MKRIICTVSNDLTYDQRMIRICGSLAAEGYEVLLVGRELPTSRPIFSQPFLQKRLKLWFKKGKFFYIELNLRLLFFLLFSKFDVLYAVDLDTLLPGRFVAALRSKKIVFDAHEYFTELPELIGRPVTKTVWELAAKLAIPGLHNAITVCESLAALFEKRYGVRFDVIRNVPFERASLQKKRVGKAPFVMIYQGALNDGRGLEESILAMKRLDSVELWICGEGDLSKNLRELVHENNLSASVRFLGQVPPDELSNLTYQADLGLNLLKNKGLNYYYSLANKAFDYIQAGLPSLNMDFPEYRRLNQDYGVFHLIAELDADEIAKAVNYLRNDKFKFEALSRNCEAAAKQLNWQMESQKLAAIFSKLK